MMIVMSRVIDGKLRYNAGHLIEAAIIHQEVFGDDKLMKPILKYVELLQKTFGPGADQIHGYPGHPEIELAILRLSKARQEKSFAELASYFISERGNPYGVNGRHFYDVEREARGEREGEWPVMFPREDPYHYQQAHLPVTQQPTIEGHSVRATYLLTAVADLCSLEQLSRSEYIDSLHRLWNNMVGKKMYLTGGIGAIKQWEGFGVDYFLPQGTDEGGCYAETCAAIGVVLLAERLLQLDLDARYADIMELCLYNAVLTGMSHDGKAFTYTNQLASSPSDLSERKDWFQCACCPPNVSRLMGYLGGFVWTHEIKEEGEANLKVHLYTSASINIPVGDAHVRVTQETDWPNDGKVKFSVDIPQGVRLNMRLRIPAWAKEWTIKPEVRNRQVHKGYLLLQSEWLQANTTFILDIPMTPHLIAPHPYANQPVAAVVREPTVYCVEDIDNPWVNDHFKASSRETRCIPNTPQLSDIHFSPSFST
jgi:uncharacterized protein